MHKVKNLTQVRNYGPSLWHGKLDNDETFVVMFFENNLHYIIAEDNIKDKWIKHSVIKKGSPHFISVHTMKEKLKDVFDFSDYTGKDFISGQWQEIIGMRGQRHG